MDDPLPFQNIPYYDCPRIRGYITSIAIGQNAPQKPVDHAWQNILAHYFRTTHYTVEREAYVDPARSKRKANVSVVNTKDNGPHEVIVAEAKKPTKRDPTNHKWDKVREQLENNMLDFRANTGNVQTMYGIAAVGSRVRFYTLFMNQNVLVPDTQDGFPGDGVLDLRNDELRIHRLLNRRLVRFNANLNNR